MQGNIETVLKATWIEVKMTGSRVVQAWPMGRCAVLRKTNLIKITSKIAGCQWLMPVILAT
jgi:hypothetical protein